MPYQKTVPPFGIMLPGSPNGAPARLFSIRSPERPSRATTRTVRIALAMEMWDAINRTWLALRRFGNGPTSREPSLNFLCCDRIEPGEPHVQNLRERRPAVLYPAHRSIPRPPSGRGK